MIENGIVAFIENEIAKKATGFKKFAIYFILPSVPKYVSSYVDKLKTLTPDLFDSNGNIVVDRVYNHAKSAIQKTGQFEFMGIIFNETDVDTLYSYIKRGGAT